jgi:hypothetical protein
MKELELRVLEMCEALLPKTTERTKTVVGRYS